MARKGNGSARDALSALDQVAAAGGIEDSFDVSELAYALSEREATAVLSAVDRAIDRGRDPRQLTRDLIEVLREAFLVHMGLVRPAADGELVRRLGPAAVTRAIEQLGEALVVMRDALDPRITLEVALVRLVRSDLDTSPAALAERIEQLERRMATGSPTPVIAPVSPAVLPPAPRPEAPRAEASSAPSRDRRAGGLDAGDPSGAGCVGAGLVACTGTLPAGGAGPGRSAEPASTSRRGRETGVHDPAQRRRRTRPERSSARARRPPRVVPRPNRRPRFPVAPLASAPATAPASPAPVGPPVAFGEVTLASLNGAKDSMLEQLERKGKILLAAGRFLHADASSAVFGLPNPDAPPALSGLGRAVAGRRAVLHRRVAVGEPRGGPAGRRAAGVARVGCAAGTGTAACRSSG